MVSHVFSLTTARMSNNDIRATVKYLLEVTAPQNMEIKRKEKFAKNERAKRK